MLHGLNREFFNASLQHSVAILDRLEHGFSVTFVLAPWSSKVMVSNETLPESPSYSKVPVMRFNGTISW
jgi:hypothetical protein